MLPSHLALAQMQPKSPSIVLRKVRCVPPWCHMSPSCAQGAPSHTQTSSFSQLITSFLVLFVHPSSNLPKESVCSVGVMGDPYILPHSKLLSSLETSVDFHGVSSHLWISSPLNDCCFLNCCHQGKTPLRKFHESMKCCFLLTCCCFHTLVVFPCFCALDPLVTLVDWVANPIIVPLSQELTSSHSNICLCLQACHICNSLFPPICQVTHCSQ
jgi:hypothetical protein